MEKEPSLNVPEEQQQEEEDDPLWKKIVELYRTEFPEMHPSPGFLERLHQRIDEYERKKSKRWWKKDN